MSSNTAPIGTLSAFAGSLTEAAVAGLRSEGWLPCDGASYPIDQLADLFSVIGTAFGGGGSTFNVPDLRGRFIRGVDHGRLHDPDAAMRTSLYPGGNVGDAVGSAQDWATARPAKAFWADSSGGHSHPAPHAPIRGVEVNRLSQQGRDSARIGGGSYVGTTSAGGSHDHIVVAGGDRETRPTNIYLNWLIKFKDT